MAGYSILNITQKLYVQQYDEFDPINLVGRADRTIFFDEEAVTRLCEQLNESNDDCYTVVEFAEL